ncbi:hypothetical protein Sru01_27930 [Sphaerisporangium rufum]|uniref:Uncharacterized protein n=1 Tax=Sphaerisporangium rufum TaxID=1381558 RepID=A0A919R129_9ACTN|nr:hypothetical protein [Sphaerisporangium rufum]GII77811.1 hypothetical protein Sru01_27930 [Sphaerisporangium rufum]
MTDFTAPVTAAAPGLAAAPAPVGPGWVAFIIVAAIGVALYFLVKSMNKQMSKIEVPREAEIGAGRRTGESGAAGTPGSETTAGPEPGTPGSETGTLGPEPGAAGPETDEPGHRPGDAR